MAKLFIRKRAPFVNWVMEPSVEEYVLDAIEDLQDAYKNTDKDGMSEYEIDRYDTLREAFELGIKKSDEEELPFYKNFEIGNKL